MAAAALTVAVVLGIPAGFRAGLIPIGSTGRSPIDARPVPDPFGASADDTGTPVAATLNARRPDGSSSRPAMAETSEAAATPPTAGRTSGRSRRPARKPAAPAPAPVQNDALTNAPDVDPLPVSPIADSLVLSSTAPPVASARAEVVLAGPALEPSQVDVRPEVKTRVTPQLPDSLRDRTIEDVVVLRVLVSPSGSAGDVRILRASKIDASLDAAAVAAVQQWRFSPALKEGRAVNCWFTVGVPIRSGS